MQIASGTKIGPYEVLSFIGAGGMGEVYRARDPRLSREVAIKLLPPQFVSDAERLRRFEQEARAAGMLSHPNILTVFDVGTENENVYVVSELLSGETLRQRLGGTPLSARKAVEIALQIAHGLGAAHEKGIVHRDLKPENIFLIKDGRVKILDFGLAKLADPVPAAGRPGSELLTVDPETKPGIVLGTVGYMSPEQVRAREVDHRSDIFSFGAILYEMLTGKRAFQRDSTADTLSAILKEDPPEVSGIVAGVPPSLERVLRHCLEKNPEQRFQSARDLAFDLEMVSGISGSSPARPAEEIKSGKSMLKAGALLAILAALAVVFWIGRQMGQKQITRTEAGAPLSFKRLTFRRGFISNARFTPDGQSVVYSASWLGAPEELFVTRPQNPVSRALGITDAAILSVSRTGEMAVLLHPRFTTGWEKIGTLARAPIDGGAPREILKDVQDADFSPDGTEFAVTHAVAGRYRLEFPIGKVLCETDGWLNYVQVAPDGKHVAFMEHRAAGDDRGTVAVADLAGKVTRLTQEFASESGLHWSLDGTEIWFSGSQEGSNEQPVYSVTLRKQMRIVTAMAGNLVLQDIDAKGNVLLNRDSRRREIVALPPGETQEHDLSWFDWSFPRYLSDDGKTIVFEEQGAGGGPNYTVFLRKTDGSPAIKLGEGFCGALSPDRNYAISQLPSDLTRFTLLPTGAGDARVISIPGFQFQASIARWFQDSKRLLVPARQNGRPPRLWICDIVTGKIVPVTPEGIAGGALITPDQSSVLVNAGQGEFLFFPVGGGAPRKAAGLQQGDALVGWITGGQGVYVASGMGIPITIDKVDLISGGRTLWKEITPPDVAGIVSIISVLITPDGKSYAYTFRRALSDLYLASGLR